ncbi:MAG: PaaI family thioesterase [Bacteroidia bacterium]
MYFQDHMPGNICFGCGRENHEGLQISSRWQEGEEKHIAVCEWMPEKRYQGWPNILNGGIIATLIDCHTMGTAMAEAYRAEGRSLDSDPIYRYATGTLNVRYLKPTPSDGPVIIKAWVTEQKGRKTTLISECWACGEKTAVAEVVALRVVDTSSGEKSVFQEGV